MAEPIIPDALSSTNDTTTDETTIQGSSKPRSFSETKEDGKERSNVSESVTDSEKQLDINETEPPDGGLRAWLVVVGAFCGTFATFGYVNAWGVFQAYYQETLLSTTSPSTIAWIGSVQYALCFVPGLVTGRLYDMGIVKAPLIIASSTLVAGTFLTAECKRYWEFLLCQGFLVGISCGVVFGPAMGLISHWFKRRRGFALGISAAGSSIGGTIFPIATHHLIQDVGFKWCMRILGFMEIAVLSIVCITLARRGPPSKVPRKIFDPKEFKNMAYTAWCLSGMVSFLGIYTVLTYIDVSATFVGISPNFSFYLIAIANFASCFGRVMGGYFSDRIGPINSMIPPTIVAGALTYAWPFAKTTAEFVIIAIFYGLTAGVFVSLLNAPFMEMGNPHDVGTKVGMGMTMIAIGAICGPPISGAINTASGGYTAVGYYAGSVVIFSCVVMAWCRWCILKGKWWGRA